MKEWHEFKIKREAANQIGDVFMHGVEKDDNGNMWVTVRKLNNATGEWTLVRRTDASLVRV